MLKSEILFEFISIQNCLLLSCPLEDIICFKQDNIFVDEYCTSLKEGLLHASKLKYTITGHKDEKISTKEAMLPLQGDRLWKFWAAHDKELHQQIQRGKDNIEDYADKINKKKAAIRTEQLKYVNSLTNGVLHSVDIKSWR